MKNVISAITIRSQFGQVLKKLENQSRGFVIEKRGVPKAVLVSIQNYIKLAAPEPEILKSIGQQSIAHSTDKLTMREIDRLIKQTRRERKNAVIKNSI